MHKTTNNIFVTSAIQRISFLEVFTVSCNLHFPVEKDSPYYKTRTLVVYKTRLFLFQSERLTKSSCPYFVSCDLHFNNK
jgi:hypothetical protein